MLESIDTDKSFLHLLLFERSIVRFVGVALILIFQHPIQRFLKALLRLCVEPLGMDCSIEQTFDGLQRFFKKCGGICKECDS